MHFKIGWDNILIILNLQYQMSGCKNYLNSSTDSGNNHHYFSSYTSEL